MEVEVEVNVRCESIDERREPVDASELSVRSFLRSMREIEKDEEDEEDEAEDEDCDDALVELLECTGVGVVPIRPYMSW